MKSDSLRAIRPPDRCGRVSAVRNSPSDVIACQRVVRRHTCSPVTRRPTRATQARRAPRVYVGQPAPKTTLKASRKVCPRLERCLGWTSARPHAAQSLTASSQIVMVGRCPFLFCLIFIILAKPFRARMDLPKESFTSSPAEINETKPHTTLASGFYSGKTA